VGEQQVVPRHLHHPRAIGQRPRAMRRLVEVWIESGADSREPSLYRKLPRSAM
jgi:hypothetical protein